MRRTRSTLGSCAPFSSSNAGNPIARSSPAVIRAGGGAGGEPARKPCPPEPAGGADHRHGHDGGDGGSPDAACQWGTAFEAADGGFHLVNVDVSLSARERGAPRAVAHEIDDPPPT